MGEILTGKERSAKITKSVSMMAQICFASIGGDNTGQGSFPNSQGAPYQGAWSYWFSAGGGPPRWGPAIKQPYIKGNNYVFDYGFNNGSTFQKMGEHTIPHLINNGGWANVNNFSWSWSGTETIEFTLAEYRSKNGTGVFYELTKAGTTVKRKAVIAGVTCYDTSLIVAAQAGPFEWNDSVNCYSTNEIGGMNGADHAKLVAWRTYAQPFAIPGVGACVVNIEIDGVPNPPVLSFSGAGATSGYGSCTVSSPTGISTNFANCTFSGMPLETIAVEANLRAWDATPESIPMEVVAVFPTYFSGVNHQKPEVRKTTVNGKATFGPVYYGGYHVSHTHSQGGEYNASTQSYTNGSPQQIVTETHNAPTDDWRVVNPSNSYYGMGNPAVEGVWLGSEFGPSTLQPGSQTPLPLNFKFAIPGQVPGLGLYQDAQVDFDGGSAGWDQENTSPPGWVAYDPGTRVSFPNGPTGPVRIGPNGVTYNPDGTTTTATQATDAGTT